MSLWPEQKEKELLRTLGKEKKPTPPACLYIYDIQIPPYDDQFTILVFIINSDVNLDF